MSTALVTMTQKSLGCPAGLSPFSVSERALAKIRDRKAPVPFSFDFSFNAYPLAYERPGPEIRIHRLHDCEQGYGPKNPRRA